MKRRSLLLYLLIILINSFLLLPVLYYPVLFIPLHFILSWISIDYLLQSKNFQTSWDKNTFAIIPALSQAIIASTIISLTEETLSIGILYFMFIFLYFMGISTIDLLIIRWRFEHYKKKKQAA